MSTGIGSTTAAAAGFRAAHRQLLHSQKNSAGAPAYSRYVNRPLGRVFAAAAFQAHLTPDQITYLSASCTFAGIVALAMLPATWWAGVLVAAALMLGYALDSADGQLARLRGGGSTAGEWLDHMVDATKTSSLHLAVLITAYRHFSLPTGWLVVPLLFSVVAGVQFFGMILVDQLIRLHQVRHAVPRPPSLAARSRLLMVLKVPIDYGFLCLVFVLLGRPLVFFGVYTIMAVGWGGYLLLALWKWRGDIEQLTRP